MYKVVGKGNRDRILYLAHVNVTEPKQSTKYRFMSQFLFPTKFYTRCGGGCQDGIDPRMYESCTWCGGGVSK